MAKTVTLTFPDSCDGAILTIWGGNIDYFGSSDFSTLEHSEITCWSGAGHDSQIAAPVWGTGDVQIDYVQAGGWFSAAFVLVIVIWLASVQLGAIINLVKKG